MHVLWLGADYTPCYCCVHDMLFACLPFMHKICPRGSLELLLSGVEYYVCTRLDRLSQLGPFGVTLHQAGLGLAMHCHVPELVKHGHHTLTLPIAFAYQSILSSCSPAPPFSSITAFLVNDLNLRICGCLPHACRSGQAHLTLGNTAV